MIIYILRIDKIRREKENESPSRVSSIVVIVNCKLEEEEKKNKT